ncbi:MAG: hypothetical protein V9G22_09600 [Ottowia sp.]
MVNLKKPIYIVTLIVSTLFSIISFASNTKENGVSQPSETAQIHQETAAETHLENEVKTPQEERAEFIEHHLLDSHDFHLFSYGPKNDEHHVSFPLPIILWDKESGLHTFMSSRFHHESAVAESKGSYYKIAPRTHL